MHLILISSDQLLHCFRANWSRKLGFKLVEIPPAVSRPYPRCHDHSCLGSAWYSRVCQTFCASLQICLGDTVQCKVKVIYTVLAEVKPTSTCYMYSIQVSSVPATSLASTHGGVYLCNPSYEFDVCRCVCTFASRAIKVLSWHVIYTLLGVESA